ncbi:ubiquitin-like modifier-activating enzyme ATG7 isoform X2 [Anabrus simplex]
MKLLSDQGEDMVNDIISGKALGNPALLTRFILLMFADLKKYNFYYWFAFPAISLPAASAVRVVGPVKKLKSVFSSEQRLSLGQVFLKISDWTQRSAFLITVAGNLVSFLPLTSIVNTLPVCTGTVDGCYLVIADPSVSDDGPGWPSRNVLTMLASHCSHLIGLHLQLISLRLVLSRSREWHTDSSLLMEVILGSVSLNDSSSLKWIGWERNSSGKYGPRSVNLSLSMDPKRLAEASVDLNLKLMKWRLVPDLNLEIVRDTKCLLLGAGTLGCAVARILMGWGVRNITLVDSGRVSYSNPVRQSLFTYEDCLNGGKSKAVAAANGLVRIFPGVNATGLDLNIPMPGHPVGPSLVNETEENVKRLEQLTDEHDALFLLMDSRESRWLPTLLGACKKKLTICAALGFDTFLVMRHGVSSESDASVNDRCIPGNQLGCYYCSDVIAPGNSLSDRTLDQQCTVTRPGLSAIASGFAVELLVSVLQHPLGAQAPADNSNTSDQESLLGRVPHSIRGHLSQFELITPASPKFTNCIACSKKVIDEYQQNGCEFLMKVFNCPDYLKDVSGLSQLCKETENVEVFDWSDSETEDVE